MDPAQPHQERSGEIVPDPLEDVLRREQSVPQRGDGPGRPDQDQPDPEEEAVEAEAPPEEEAPSEEEKSEKSE